MPNRICLELCFTKYNACLVRDGGSFPTLSNSISLLTKTFPQPLYCSCQEVNGDGTKDDGGSTRHIGGIGEPKAAQAAGIADESREEKDAAEGAGEEGRRHLRHGEKRHDEDDADHVEAAHDGERHEGRHDGFERADGKTLRAGEIAVVGNENDGVEATIEEEEGEGGQHAHQPKVALRDGEHIAKEVGGEVGHEAWREVGKQDADAHAECPEQGDGGIFPHALLARKRPNAQTGEKGEDGGTDKGRETEIGTQANTAQGGVGHATAHDDHAARHDIGADHSAEQTGQKAAEQGMLEEGIGDEHRLMFDVFCKFTKNLSDGRNEWFIKWQATRENTNKNTGQNCSTYSLTIPKNRAIPLCEESPGFYYCSARIAISWGIQVLA